MTDRLVAAGGTLLLLAALVILWVARLGVHRELYVSELGAQGQPTAQWFQVMLLLIVAGASLIGWAGRGIRSRPRLLRLWAPDLINMHNDWALAGSLICLATALAVTVWLAFQLWSDWTRWVRLDPHAASGVVEWREK